MPAIFASTPSTSTGLVDITSVAGFTGTASMTVVVAYGATDIEDAAYYNEQVIPIDVSAPGFTLTGPSGATYSAGQNVTFQWTASPLAKSDSIDLAYAPNATAWSPNATWIGGPSTAANGRGSYAWNTAGLAGTFFTCSTQHIGYQRVHFLGTRGRIELEIPFNIPPDRPTRIFIDSTGDLTFSGITTETFPAADQYTLQGDAFARAVREDTEVPVPLEDSIGNMAVIEAVFRSGKTGQWETVAR